LCTNQYYSWHSPPPSLPHRYFAIHIALCMVSAQPPCFGHLTCNIDMGIGNIGLILDVSRGKPVDSEEGLSTTGPQSAPIVVQWSKVPPRCQQNRSPHRRNADCGPVVEGPSSLSTKQESSPERLTGCDHPNCPTSVPHGIRTLDFLTARRNLC